MGENYMKGIKEKELATRREEKQGEEDSIRISLRRRRCKRRRMKGGANTKGVATWGRANNSADDTLR